MVLVKIILSSFFSFSFAGDYYSDVQKLKCESDVTKMRAQYVRLLKDAPKHIASLSNDAVDAKLSLKERDIIFVTLLKPELLKDKIPYAAMYTDCAKVHHHYLQKPSKKNLRTWIACVEHGYGRDALPKTYEFLRDCYKRISR